MKRDDSDQYEDIFLSGVSLLDVRAPVEFEKGAFPTSTNIPLLDDEQRDLIGKQYKNAGQDEAIKLGLELATPEIRRSRLQYWQDFVKQHPQGYLYCFRGGLRSRTTQQWLREQGVDYPLIQGGYKAMRSFLLQQLELAARHLPLLILSGMTGSGKTRVLQQTRHHIDLEGLANHRGSAFGRDPLDYQPSQIDWENQLAVACLKHRHHYPKGTLLLEDEGRMIGRIVVPTEFYQSMERSPRIYLERSVKQRTDIIREDYIESNWPHYQQVHGEQATSVFSSFVLDNLARIRNRLGGERYKTLHASFSRALDMLFNNGQSEDFNEGIQMLLTDYYDPMYRYQLQKKPVDILFSGDEKALLEWVEEHVNGSSLNPEP